MRERLLTCWVRLTGIVRDRLEVARANPEAGFTAEKMVLIAAAVLIAIAAMAVLGPKIIAKINELDL